MKTVLRIEGIGTETFEGDCSVKEAMNLAGLNRSEWKVEKTKESATKIEYTLTSRPVVVVMPPVQLYSSQPTPPPMVPPQNSGKIEEETTEQPLESIVSSHVVFSLQEFQACHGIQGVDENIAHIF